MRLRFSPHLESREIATMKFDNLQLPLDGFEVVREHINSAFSSLNDYSPLQMKVNRSDFGNESPDWNGELVGKKCTFPAQWNCEYSVSWDVPHDDDETNHAYFE